jgi:hypothetical protein
MIRLTVGSAKREHGSHRRAAVAAAALVLALVVACSSGPDPEYSGIPGFEPTVKMVVANPTDRYFVIDSNEVVVVSRDRTLLGGMFLLLDDAQLPYRRHFQTLPPRTTVVLTIQPQDSAAVDSIVKASRSRLVVYERVIVPRDNSGNPLPIARYLVSSVRNKVARAWILSTDTTAGPRQPTDWVVAGATQLITGFPTTGVRNTQLASQLGDLAPLDSLIRMEIPESAIPAGAAGDGALGGVQQGRVDSRGRPINAPPPRRLPPQSLAALQAGSLMEFMWAREGRGIVKQLIDRTRRGEPLSAVIANAVSLPHTVAGLDSVWKASLTPPKPAKKK